MTDCVSVVVPTYNAAPYLDRAIRSIREQSFADLEIICVNDGSTDDSLNVILHHANEDPRIVVIDKPNEGYGASCNKGIAKATSTWVSIVEPDDWIEPSMYESMLSLPSAILGKSDVVKSPYWRIIPQADGSFEKKPCSYIDQPLPKRQPFTLEKLPNLIAEHPSIWSALYRKSFLLDNGIAFPEYPGAGWADNPFLVETLCQARIAYANAPNYCYCEETEEQAETFTRNNYPIMFDRWHTMCDIMERLNVADASIWRAHYRRGFSYAERTVEVLGQKDDARALVYSMFTRMDADIVLKDLSLTHERKELFAQIMELDGFELSGAQKAITQASRALKMARDVGVANTLRSIRSYLK